MANYDVPVEYSDLQNKIENFMEMNKEEVNWTNNFFPFGAKSKDDPLATASIYLHYGYRDRAIESINEAISIYKLVIEDGKESIQNNLDKTITFLECAQKLELFTPPENKPWYHRIFGNNQSRKT